MKVDDTYHFCLHWLQHAAYMHDGIAFAKWTPGYANVERWAENVLDQVKKLHEGHGLALLNLPEA